MIKSIEELSEELCNYCPIDEEFRGIYSTPGGISIGCEGSYCKKAYENYLEEFAETDKETK